MNCEQDYGVIATSMPTGALAGNQPCSRILDPSFREVLTAEVVSFKYFFYAYPAISQLEI